MGICSSTGGLGRAKAMLWILSTYGYLLTCSCYGSAIAMAESCHKSANPALPGLTEPITRSTWGELQATKKARHGLFLILDLGLSGCGGGLMASAFSLRSRSA